MLLVFSLLFFLSLFHSLSLSLSPFNNIANVVQLPLPLFLYPSILTRTAHRQHRESFANCVLPTVRKLNERLQLCSRCCNEPRSSSGSCLFYKFIIGVTTNYWIPSLAPTLFLVLTAISSHPLQYTLFYFFFVFLNDTSSFSILVPSVFQITRNLS